MFKLNSNNPKNLSISTQWLITGLLLILTAISRSDYLTHFQDASWSVFFLIGFYLRSYIGLPLIIVSVIAIDFAQIASRGGHQDYFLSPSYLYIIPAYSALWLAGRFFASKYSETIKGLLLFILSAVVGIVICHLISSGGYYWMSMKFIELSFSEFITRTLEYLPLALKINLLYLFTIAALHLSILKIPTLDKQH